jgi:hypothetical protein
MISGLDFNRSVGCCLLASLGVLEVKPDDDLDPAGL